MHGGWLGSLDWLQRHNMLYGTELAETEAFLLIYIFICLFT